MFFLLLDKKEEGALSLMNRIKLYYHLAICSVCKLFARHNEAIIKNIRGLEIHSSTSLSENEKQQMIANLEK